MPFLSNAAVLRLGQPPLVEVHFAEEVLAHFEKNMQDAFWKTEAGGQLFAKISGERWEIVKATGPRSSDYRRRFRFFPKRTDEQSEIGKCFDDGLHYVGDWHTHPEATPTPSCMDVTSMDDLVRQSKHELPGFLMVIVGTEDSAQGLWVSLHTPSGARLTLVDQNRNPPFGA